MARPRTPLDERFWQHVNKSGPTVVAALGCCWVWTGMRNGHGYGVILQGGRRSRLLRAHRVAFFLAHERWPEPCALHRCDNPACVRPDHLYEGDRADNVRDMMERGRHVVGTRHAGEANGFAKLTNVQRDELRRRHADGESMRALAQRFGVTRQGVSYILKRGVA